MAPSLTHEERLSLARIQLKQLRDRQVDWATTELGDRLKLLRRFRKMLLNETRSLIALIPDHGAIDVMTAEILPLLAATGFLGREALAILKPISLALRGRPLWLWGIRSRVVRKPLGTVLILAPGNYPLMLGAIQALQALIAGNAVGLKPAPGRSALLLRFASLLTRAGFPEGIIEILPEDSGPQASAAGYDLIVLTGSEQTGKKVALAAASTLTPTIMELSGADPVFVLPSGDLNLVARALHFGLTLKQGSTCIAPRRVYVHKMHRDALEARLSRIFRQSSIALQQKTCPALSQLVSAVGQAGGDIRQMGPATILLLDAESAELADVDLFAPWLALIGVSDMVEAVQLENRSRHALGASIFGEEKVAQALAKQIPAGSITINDLIVPTADPRLPFGGAKASGYGATRGREGLLSMTRPVSISTRRSGAFHLLARVRRWHARYSR
ncbi:aldehyde dehydrogenase family protein [Asaia sp. BMEF1]|uniref:aldehyde dehydrogenase family protein n=1 Tax=Asaia sp. BMEF1 TaxID=3155932 RepID=UPI003F66B341